MRKPAGLEPLAGGAPRPAGPPPGWAGMCCGCAAWHTAFLLKGAPAGGGLVQRPAARPAEAAATGCTLPDCRRRARVGGLRVAGVP